ncbi:MAG TPA: pseudouridine synthase [Candidatus Omnitrophica bacterium]|nr:pseudouridine synthase [Candidatus Omnitrophota bacterium]HCI44937.1 pseudouridine synthase [Candidatus Omnitrophota bacterium]
MQMRLQVFLSRNGVCSRRKAFDLVMSGHVSVNGRPVVEPSTPVDPDKDKVCVDDKVVAAKAYTYILFNKPQGCVTTREDRFAEKTVFDLLPSEFRHLVPVGRLDKDTEGLLLLTNDGDLTYRLTHPSFDIDKTYRVRMTGTLEPQDRQALEKGVVIEGRRTAPAKIQDARRAGNNTEFLITIHEGRKRQVRLMVAHVGKKVIYLQRVAQGPLKLGDLKLGHWRELKNQEIQILHKIAPLVKREA